MRNVVPIRQTHASIQDLSIILACASSGRRMRSFGPKSLIDCGGKPLIQNQIETLKSKFPNIYDILVVTGYSADKVFKVVPPGCRILENENWEQTNVSRSLAIGLRAAKSENILIVYGDIFFTERVFQNFRTDSGVAVDSHGCIEDDKVGVILSADGLSVDHFSFGGKGQAKWGQIAFFTGKELELLRKIVFLRSNDSWCGSEIFNQILDKGGILRAYSVEKDSGLTEFNTIKCVEKFKANAEEN